MLPIIITTKSWIRYYLEDIVTDEWHEITAYVSYGKSRYRRYPWGTIWYNTVWMNVEEQGKSLEALLTKRGYI